MLTYDLSKRKRENMYEYLYRSIRDDILQGILKEKEKLPSKRALAQHLGVSVKTVENAYDQLLLEGYIFSEEKRGYFVACVQQMQGIQNILEPYTTKYKEEEFAADFTFNGINYDRFPFSTWAKVMRETLTDYDTSLLNTVPFNGVEKLRREIAGYLFRYRGMRVSPDNIIVGAGTEYLYNRILQLLGQEACYAIENPGYQKIVKIYEAGHAKWTSVDIDEKGMNVEALKKTNANVVHVSPTHHYPMGLVMPIGRRQELLNWANEERNRYIIEDDFDCEFRISGKPIPSMQSLDSGHRVIYMNTFSKTMVPSLRVSYMVLPEKLMERYIATMNFYSCTVSGFEQYALASFMEKGHFERHIRRMVNYYRQQREKILKIFKESSLMSVSRILEDDAGTHFLLQVFTDLTDTQIKWAAKEKGIMINCLSEFCFDNAQKYRGFLIINYSDMEDTKLRRAIRELEEILSISI